MVGDDFASNKEVLIAIAHVVRKGKLPQIRELLVLVGSFLETLKIIMVKRDLQEANRRYVNVDGIFFAYARVKASSCICWHVASRAKDSIAVSSAFNGRRSPDLRTCS